MARKVTRSLSDPRVRKERLEQARRCLMSAASESQALCDPRAQRGKADESDIDDMIVDVIDNAEKAIELLSSLLP